MKVNIREQINISDEQRFALAAQLDGEGARRRVATRAEIQAFAWEHGAGWADKLGVAEPTSVLGDLL